jgi:hypothetical protein
VLLPWWSSDHAPDSRGGATVKHKLTEEEGDTMSEHKDVGQDVADEPMMKWTKKKLVKELRQSKRMFAALVKADRSQEDFKNQANYERAKNKRLAESNIDFMRENELMRSLLKEVL